MSRSACITVLLAAVACRAQPSTILTEPAEEVLARLATSGHAIDASLGGGRVRYLGFEALPEGALPGDQVTIIHYWQANARLDRPYKVFVHALVQGAAGWVPHGDHVPAPSPDRWPIGRVILDEHSMRLPDRLPGNRIDLRVGLYHGNYRVPIDGEDKQDGTHRILAGGFAVSGVPVPLPSYSAPRLRAPPRLDGAIKESEWLGAPWIEGFERSRGDGPSRKRTRARLAWDETHLYVAMVAHDPDIQGTYTSRDDPIYREEALEIFVDPTCSRSGYVELQVSPRGTLFDAAFSGGPRRNMNKGYNARYNVALEVSGTIGVSSDRDEQWSTEWAIEVASIPGSKTRLEPDSRWCINLFRVGKDREGGTQVADESAWSPPLMGDFHNLERFGDLWFKERVEP